MEPKYPIIPLLYIPKEKAFPYSEEFCYSPMATGLTHKIIFSYSLATHTQKKIKT